MIQNLVHDRPSCRSALSRLYAHGTSQSDAEVVNEVLDEFNRQLNDIGVKGYTLSEVIEAYGKDED